MFCIRRFGYYYSSLLVFSCISNFEFFLMNGLTLNQKQIILDAMLRVGIKDSRQDMGLSK